MSVSVHSLPHSFPFLFFSLVAREKKRNKKKRSYKGVHSITTHDLTLGLTQQ